MNKILCAALLFIALAVTAPALDLGDPAPALTVGKWITGSPVDPTKVDDQTFYLVEVWGVTCPPCVRSIPLLNEIQKKYAGQGLKIVSFTNDEEAEVRPFLEKHPMEYSSFVDKDGGSTISYMAADNRTTIPHAFLFDKSGALVWIGNPLDNLEKRVNQVISGQLSGEKAQKVRTLRDELQEAFASQNFSKVLDNLDKLEGLEPDNSQYYQIHYRILTELGEADPFEVKDLLDKWYKGVQDDAEGLVILSMIAIDQGHPAARNPQLAITAARKAYAMESDAKPQAGLNLAEAYKAVGRIDLGLKVLDQVAAEAKSVEVEEMVQAIKSFYNRLQKVAENPEAEYKP